NTGLTESTIYYYRVRASNGAGPSAYSNMAGTMTPATLPAAPTGLSATAISSTRIDISWTDNSSNETRFKVERGSTSLGPWTQIATPAANAVTYSDTTVSPSTLYFYRVRANNSAGDSSYTNTASATTPATTQTATPSPTPTPTRTPTPVPPTATPTATP